MRAVSRRLFPAPSQHVWRATLFRSADQVRKALKESRSDVYSNSDTTAGRLSNQTFGNNTAAALQAFDTLEKHPTTRPIFDACGIMAHWKLLDVYHAPFPVIDRLRGLGHSNARASYSSLHAEILVKKGHFVPTESLYMGATAMLLFGVKPLAALITATTPLIDRAIYNSINWYYSTTPLADTLMHEMTHTINHVVAPSPPLITYKTLHAARIWAKTSLSNIDFMNGDRELGEEFANLDMNRNEMQASTSVEPFDKQEQQAFKDALLKDLALNKAKGHVQTAKMYALLRAQLYWKTTDNPNISEITARIAEVIIRHNDLPKIQSLIPHTFAVFEKKLLSRCIDFVIREDRAPFVANTVFAENTHQNAKHMLLEILNEPQFKKALYNPNTSLEKHNKQLNQLAKAMQPDILAINPELTNAKSKMRNTITRHMEQLNMPVLRCIDASYETQR